MLRKNRHIASVDGTQGCACRPDQGCAKMPRKRRSKRNWSPLEFSQQFSFDPCGNLAKEELFVHCRRVQSASFVAHLERTAMSRVGASYRTASGAAIPNLGQQDVREGKITHQATGKVTSIERNFHSSNVGSG